MKKRKGLLIALTIIVAMAIGIFVLVHTLFYSMYRLPKGEYLGESTSPKGTYTVRAYLCNGGATTSHAVRGEVVTNSKGGKAKNIYWDYKIDEADMSWEDENTVIINRHKIDLPKGKYDWRRDKH